MLDYLSIITPLVERRFILVDTNFLIDASRQWSVFEPVFEFFNGAKAILATNELVKSEFMLGIRSPEEYAAKEQFFSKAIQLDHPTSEAAKKIATTDAIKLLGDNKNKTEICDLYLAAIAIQYQRSTGVYILSKNFKDFSDRIFDTAGIVPVKTSPYISVYGLFKYSPDKADKILGAFGTQ